MSDFREAAREWLDSHYGETGPHSWRALVNRLVLDPNPPDIVVLKNLVAAIMRERRYLLPSLLQDKVPESIPEGSALDSIIDVILHDICKVVWMREWLGKQEAAVQRAMKERLLRKGREHRMRRDGEKGGGG